MGQLIDALESLTQPVIFVVVLTTAWVWYDAFNNGVQESKIVGWVAGSLLVWPVFFTLYVKKRPARMAVRQAERAERMEQARGAGDAFAVAKIAADAHLVCPHCQTIGTVQTTKYEIMRVSGDGPGKNVFKQTPSGSWEFSREDELRFSRLGPGYVSKLACGTCQSNWII